jgi:hypothetical protein
MYIIPEIHQENQKHFKWWNQAIHKLGTHICKGHVETFVLIYHDRNTNLNRSMICVFTLYPIHEYMSFPSVRNIVVIWQSQGMSTFPRRNTIKLKGFGEILHLNIFH